MEATADAAMTAQEESRTVVKRDGSKQTFDKEKILKRVQALSDGLNKEYVTYDAIVEKVCNGIYNGKFSLTPTYPS